MRNEDEDDEEDERIFRQLQRKPGARSAVKPTTRRRQDLFVKIPLWWAQAAAKASHMPGFIVCVELLHRSWKAKSLTFSLPNGRLKNDGASREVKRRILRELESAGLISVIRRHGKSPIVTLLFT
jgi:hypothetical protein